MNTVEDIVECLKTNDFPLQSFITLMFNGDTYEFLDSIKYLLNKGLTKEELISALCVYENNSLFYLTKTFKLNIKELKIRAEENEKYNLLVSPLSSFIG